MPPRLVRGGTPTANDQNTVTITYDKALVHIEHTLGGPLAETLDPISVMNDAGHYMASIHPWKWCEKTSGEILTSDTAVTSMSYDAPNFLQLLGYSPRATDTRFTPSVADLGGTGWLLVSTSELENIRRAKAYPLSSGDKLPPHVSYFALVYTSQKEPGIDVVMATGASSQRELTLVYRQGWYPLVSTGSSFKMPDWMESVYCQCLRAFARGYEEEDEASLAQRLNDISTGPLVAAAVSSENSYSPAFRRSQLPPSSVVGR